MTRLNDDTTRSGSTTNTAASTTRSVVLPVYDEYPVVWSSMVDRLLERGWDEVVVTVDAPDERTRETLRQVTERPGVRHSVSDERRGKGGALAAGLETCSGDVLGFVDADGAVAPDDLDCIYQLVETGDTEVAIGSRNLIGEERESQSMLRRICSAGYGFLARRATGVPVNDFQCGAKAFTREAWEHVRDDLEEEGFAFDTELVTRWYHADFEIRELSVDWQDPGDSDVRLRSDIGKMFTALGRIRRRRPEMDTTRAGQTSELRVGLVSCHPPDQGHLAEYCEELATSYGDRDDVDLTVFSRRSDYAPTVERRENYEIRRVWDRDSFTGSVALLRELLTGDFDAVHFNVHMTYFGTTNHYRMLGLSLPPLLSRALDAEVVTTLHDMLEVVEDTVIEEEIGVVEGLGAVLATQLVLLGDATTVTSEEYLDVIDSRYQATDVHHVPHGTFSTATTTEVSLDDPLRVLVFGHLGPTKDVESTVEAIERVREEVPDAELWIAGDSHPGYPGYREKLEKRFSDAPGVRFTGYVEDHEMDELWDSVSLLVLPYQTCTGVSGVFQLAKSYGVPTVCYDVDGIRTSTVETGGEAVFVPPERPEELADVVCSLWDDEERLRQLARANAAAADAFTIEDTVDDLVDLFERRRDPGRDDPPTDGSEASEDAAVVTAATGNGATGSVVERPDGDAQTAIEATNGDTPSTIDATSRRTDSANGGATVTDATASADAVSTKVSGERLLTFLDDVKCPTPECSGTLSREPYKDTDAVVCERCGSPAIRIWGDDA